MHKLEILNAHFPITDDSNTMNTIIQVPDAKLRSCLVPRLPEEVDLAHDGSLDREESINCFAKVDVLALLKAVSEIDDFTKVEAGVGPVAAHAKDEDKIML